MSVALLWGFQQTGWLVAAGVHGHKMLCRLLRAVFGDLQCAEVVGTHQPNNVVSVQPRLGPDGFSMSPDDLVLQMYQEDFGRHTGQRVCTAYLQHLPAFSGCCPIG